MNLNFSITWELHEELDSSSDRAKEIIADGQPFEVPLVIVAKRQTAGRGRGGRKWWTGEGSIAASLIVASDRDTTPFLSLIMAVAISDSLEPLVPDFPVNIHWPNDVQLDGRKVAGILTESPKPQFAIIGFGLNVNNSMSDSPPDMRNLPLTSVFDVIGRKIDAEILLETLLARFLEEKGRFALDRAGLIEKVRSRCVQIGRETDVQCGEKRISGFCRGIADDGSMILDKDGEILHIR